MIGDYTDEFFEFRWNLIQINIADQNLEIGKLFQLLRQAPSAL